jgi:hypothetical protein
MGTFLYLAIETLAIAVAAYVGRALAIGRRQKIAFGALAAVSMVLISWQGWRSARGHRLAQQEAAKALDQDALRVSAARDETAEARREAQLYRQELAKLSGREPAETAGQPQERAGPHPAGSASAPGGVSAGPRVLSGEQRDEIVKLLKKMGPHSIVVRYAQGNDESQHYADALASVLRDAGWTFRTPKFVQWSDYPHGVVILVQDLQAVPRDADQFAIVLNKAGIQVRWSEESSLDPGTFDVLVGPP